MPKRATKVILSEREKEELDQLTKRHRSEQQQAQRARMVLASAQGHSNAHIARELEVGVDTVRLWRGRYVGVLGVYLQGRMIVLECRFHRTQHHHHQLLNLTYILIL